MCLVEIEGKRGNVPVLLTKDMIASLKNILHFLKAKKINLTKPYFFPSTSSLKKNMRGSDILRKTTHQAQLKEPETITGTQLRKYMATAIQILNRGEMDWVAKHLGHDIQIHRKFYRF